MSRDYKDEYKKFQSSEEQKKYRAARNKARREATREGRVHKGDGKDIDHMRPLSKGGSTGKSNTRVISRSANRAKRNGD
jgi:hypothetical protein